jgi:signal transduction histidine kinase
MTVRARIALTIFATGVLTALAVIAAVLVAFQRFEHESAYYRASAFLDRVVRNHPDLLELHQRHPREFVEFLRSLVLFEPDTQLYLLDAEGKVLAGSGDKALPEGFRVGLAPVQQAAGPVPMPYVMGDDPERMDDDAVIAARALRRTIIRNDEPVGGYLYLVCHKPPLPDGRIEALRSSFAVPLIAAIGVLVALATALALWITGVVTRPLRELSDAVAQVMRDGLDAGPVAAPAGLATRDADDEFGRLGAGFRAMLDGLREQWRARQRLDRYRREGVSNLSHDLRSPLTATAACLETLQARWAGDAGRLLEVALRNTRNAAALVRSLGDLAQLDEPQFELRREVIDAGELLGDIAQRFAPRAAAARVDLAAEAAEGALLAPLDVELTERAVANLVDNALKFCPAGGRVRLRAAQEGGWLRVTVADTGPGIAEAELPQLFDRFYQSRSTVAPATGEGGKGLGLAIVKRIAELHGGRVEITSRVGEGTAVTIVLPSPEA